MSDQLLQGGEVFEILDHTTATDWERFIANLEEVLTDWKLSCQSETQQPYVELPEEAISSGIWHEKHEEVRFGSVKFDLRFQYISPQNIIGLPTTTTPNSSSASLAADDEFEDASEEINIHQAEIPKEKEREHGEHELPDLVPDCLLDLMSHNQDFASRAHCIVRWYNLRRFILLSLRGDTIISEDRVKLILSSASVALANIDCHIPIFVQIHNPKNSFFQGISEHYNIRTTYEMVLFKQGLKNYRYLSELLGVFREKTSSSLNDPMTVTARLNYCLDSIILYKQESKHQADQVTETDSGKSIQNSNPSEKVTSRQSLTAGASFEQVVEELPNQIPHQHQIVKLLHVAALWPPVSDKVINDSQVHSDLDPAEAPIWTMRCVSHDTCPMKLVHETQAIHQIFCSAIDYAYEILDGETSFSGFDRETLKSECLKLSYDLAVKPEVVLSKRSGDRTRKLAALMFYMSAEMKQSDDTLDEITSHLRKKPSLIEIYRNFNRDNKPNVKEFIMRTTISRPFAPISSPALPQRIFATLCDNEFRLCGAFSESTN